MDDLSRRCWRLRSTQLLFRDCRTILQSCHLQLQAPMGCSLLPGAAQRREMSRGGWPQLRRGGDSDGARRGRGDSKDSLSSLGPGRAFLLPVPRCPCCWGRAAFWGDRQRLSPAFSSGWVTRQGHVRYRGHSAAQGAGGWELISGSFPGNQQAGDASPSSRNRVSDGRAPGAHPERAGKGGVSGALKVSVPVGGGGYLGCPGREGEVGEQINREDLGESPLKGGSLSNTWSRCCKARQHSPPRGALRRGMPSSPALTVLLKCELQH